MKPSEVNLLFTSAGRRVELLRAFKAAYASEGLHGRIVATDIDVLAPALRVADVAELVPPTGDEEYVDVVVSLCRKYRVDLVFPLTDPDIPVLAAARERLLGAGTAAATMPPAGVNIAADKWATSEFLREIGVATPRTWLGEDFEPDHSVEYPVYLKPRFGSASAHTARVDGPEELQTFLHRTPQPVVQEFLRGPEVTCDLAYSLDGEFLGMCQRMRITVRGGEVQKGFTVWDEAIARDCLAIGKALEARGPLTIQCLFQGETPRFTEINARFGGGLPLAIAAGVDIPRWYLALAAGRRPAVPPLGSYTLGLFLSRFDESFFGPPVVTT